MKAWFRLLSARTLLLLSGALVPLGVVPVLYLLALVGWQISARIQGGVWVRLPATLVFTDPSLLQAGKAAPVLPFIPYVDWSGSTTDAAVWILSQLHVGLVPALLGCAIAAFGVVGVLRQKTAIRVQKQRKADRVRRMQDYRRESSPADAVEGRREPFIGTGGFARNTDRRVA